MSQTTVAGALTHGSKRPRTRLGRAEESALLSTVVAGQAAAAELRGDVSPGRRVELEVTVRAAGEARRIVLEAHQGFVAVIAKRYRYSGVPMADLIQEGNLGLMAALDRFEPTVGCRFATFAGFWVRQTILAGIPRHRGGFCLTRGVAREVYRLRKVRARLEAETGKATTVEVAEAAGVSPVRVLRLEALNQPHLSLTEAVTSTTVDATDDGDPAIGSEVPVEAIRELVQQLPVRQQFVISRRYGLGTTPQLQSEVAEELGITSSRVSQIEREALDRLRRLAGGRRDLLVA